MADTETTSSQSNCQPLSISNDDSVPNCPHKVIKLTKSDLQTARMSTKGNDQSLIPVQTNLHRLIQNKLKRKKVLAKNSNSSPDEVENRKKKKTVDLQKTEDCDRTDPSPGDVQEGKVEDKIAAKPPLPPRTDKMASPNLVRPPPIRLKRKFGEQNTSLVQKLNAQAEQLRLEVTELKTALANERNAVRALRAQNEAEARKSKAEIKKLQVALELSKKAAFTGTVPTGQKKSSKDEATSIKDFGTNGGAELGRMTNEILALKEANRILEEKIQMHTEAERRRNSDIRELKDSYEIRLTQISKSAKTEINRLLEEIKSKERNIGQLKKEMQSLKCSTANRRDTNNNSNNSSNNNGTTTRNAQHPPEMRKLKDIERTNSTSTTNQKCINTTCGDSDFNTVPHEITERILEAHNDLHIFAAKDINSSDTDSALSSAPQSISPQPPPSGIEPADIWQSVKGYSKELENLQKINEEVQKENDQLQMELKSAKEQILDLEKTALEVEAHNSNKMQHCIERIRYLEMREDNLIKESYELREQNELLEFRILELEESHDKWSLKSNSTPDTRDMWTDTEKDPDDILMYTDRSDSGITSPHILHRIYERNVVSPCDLSLLDQVSNDEIKRRITAMTKIANFDEEDKVCLFQVLNLINNLETLSQDSLMVNDEIMSLEMVKSKASDYSSSASSSPRTLLTEAQPLQKGKKIIATVLPYTSTLSTPSDSPRRFRSWNSSSLQESGVFEGDSSDSFYSQATQTEAEDFPCTDTPATGDLCAEIQKLNKFREKIEEVVTKQSAKAPVSVPTILSPNLSDQRRLQFYKDRLELLENKILIYESSGDLQTKRLAERLQREIHLESLVKELRQRVESLEAENLRLEEEKCEFEEAENDTRLRLQRLEVDLEILNQRNIELEMSREACQSKLKDSKSQCANLQETVLQSQEKMKKVEGEKKSLSTALGMIKASMPAIALFGALMVHGGEQPPDIPYTCCNCHPQPSQVKNYSTQPCETLAPALQNPVGMQEQLHQLMEREKELTHNINELNRAYQETMENADILWAQIEKDYKDKLTRSAEVEQCLKMKIIQLENRLNSDSSCAHERIVQLEDNETLMKHKISILTKHNKEVVAEHEALVADYQSVKDEMFRLKKYIEGPGQEMIEREKKKCRELEDDLKSMNRLVCDMEDQHKKEVQTIRLQLCKASKELENIEVTNSELKEEVHTLENQIRELQKQRQQDEEKIQCLQEEIKAKEENAPKPCTCAEGGPGASLAQEMYPDLASPGDTTGKFVNFDGVDDLKTAARKLSEALSNIRHCDNCGNHTKDIQKMAYDVKHFSDNIRTTLGDEVSEDEQEVEENEKTEKIEKLDGDGGGADGQGGDDGKGGDDDQGGGGGATNEKAIEDAEGGDEKPEESEKDAPTEDAAADDAPAEDAPVEKEAAVVEVENVFTSTQCANENLKDESKNLARGVLNSLPTSLKDAHVKELPSKAKSSVELEEMSCEVSSIEYKKMACEISSIQLEKLPCKKSSSEKKQLPCEEEKPDTVDVAVATEQGDSNHQFTYLIQKLIDAFKSTDHNIRTPPQTVQSSHNIEATQISARKDIDLNRSRLIIPTLDICDPENEFVHLKESEVIDNSQSQPSVATSVPGPYSGDSEEISEHLIATQSLCCEQSEDVQSKSSQSEYKIKKKPKKRGHLHTLLNLIRSSVTDSADLRDSEENLKSLYKANKLFKTNLKLALRFQNGKPANCYDEIVRAMACVQTIQNIYKPVYIPVLKTLEERVHTSLTEYYKETPAPKLYCTVFYPENRIDDSPKKM